MAFSVSPSGMANIVYTVYRVYALYLGYSERAFMDTMFLLITLLYVIWYERRVIKSPNKSLMNTTSWQQNNVQTTNTEIDLKDRTSNWRDLVVVGLVIFTPIVLAIGNGMLSWTEKY